MTSSEHEITHRHIALAWKDCIADLRQRIADMTEEECRVLHKRHNVSPYVDIKALILDAIGEAE